MKYEVRHQDLTGDIRDFPIEVVQEMVNRQYIPNIKVFQFDRLEGEEEGGFSWAKQPEGVKFWEDVIANRRFDLFFSNDITDITDPNISMSQVSDGFHTFEELYEFRKIYNAALFNEWAKNYDPKYSGLNDSDFPNYSKMRAHYNVHKSWKHSDGELCFGGGWFIVCAKLPAGLISNHYERKDWDLFKIPEVEKSMFEYDGHTSQDVLTRLKALFTY